MRKLWLQPDREVALSRIAAVAERSVQTLAGTALTVFLARYLSGEEFGRLAAATSFVMIGGQIAATGLRGTVTVAVKTWALDPLAIVWSALVIRLAVAVVVLLAVVVAAPVVLPSVSVGVAGALAVGLALRSTEVSEYALQGQSRFAELLRWRLVGIGLVVAVGALASTILQGDLLGAVLRAGVLAAAPTVVLLRFFRRVVVRQPEFGKVAQLARQSWPLMVSGTGALIYLRVDQVFLARSVDLPVVGAYAIVATAAEAASVVSTGLANSSYAAMDTAERYRQQVALMLAQQIRLGTLAFVAVSCTGVILLPRLFPSLEFSSAVIVVYSSAMPFLFVRNGWSKVLAHEGAYGVSLLSHLSGAFINILLNLALIPRYGALAAAATTLLSYSVAGHLAFLAVPRYRGLVGQSFKQAFYRSKEHGG